MATQISNPYVIVNSVQFAIVPNSLKYKDGLGEQKMKAASAGGNQVEIVYAEDVETNIGMVSFELFATPENIAAARAWKVLKNENLVQVLANTLEGSLTRSFQQAALLSDVENALGSDTTISIEFKSNPAI